MIANIFPFFFFFEVVSVWEKECEALKQQIQLQKMELEQKEMKNMAIQTENVQPIETQNVQPIVEKKDFQPIAREDFQPIDWDRTSPCSTGTATASPSLESLKQIKIPYNPTDLDFPSSLTIPAKYIHESKEKTNILCLKNGRVPKA